MTKKLEKIYGCNRIELPKDYDPYDAAIKKQLNENADDKNFIHIIHGVPVLACGSKKQNGKTCTQYAGQGTNHVGHGRCKNHGGNSPGPITPEGKAIVSQNSRLHGFYSQVLSADERDYFEALSTDEEGTSLKLEILMLKAKILKYLDNWRKKYDAILEKEGQEQADTKTRVYTRTSDEKGATTFSYFQAGTLEDKTLDRALNTLRRLCDTYAKLNEGGDEDSLVNQINAELRAASHGQVSVSWGNKPQTRKKKGGAKE